MFLWFYHVLNPKEHVFEDGEYVFLSLNHVFARREHVLSRIEYVLLDSKHVFAAGEYVLAANEYVLPVWKHVFTDGEHVLARLEHVLADGNHMVNLFYQMGNLPDQVVGRARHVEIIFHRVAAIWQLVAPLPEVMFASKYQGLLQS